MKPVVPTPPRPWRYSITSVFAPCLAAAMPAGAPPVPPPTTTTSYSPSTGTLRAREETLPWILCWGRNPFRFSRISPVSTACPVLLRSVTWDGLDNFLTSCAAAAPMRWPTPINSSGRSSFSAVARDTSVQPPSTNREVIPFGLKTSRLISSAPGQGPVTVLSDSTGSGGTWKSSSDESATSGFQVRSRAICSAWANDAKESSSIGILSTYSKA